MTPSPSSHRFKPGDKVIINRPGFPYFGRRGFVTVRDHGFVRVRLDGWTEPYDFGVDEADLALDILETLADL